MNMVFDDVEIFMKAAGQTTNEHNEQQANLYQKLIEEEYGEFLEAVNVANDAETLDACFDMIWVIVGYMKSRGWPCELAWHEGAESNLRKIDPDTKTVLRREDGKVLKPVWWNPPNFEKFV